MAQASILGAYASEARLEQERVQAQREEPLTVWKIALGVFVGMQMAVAVSAALGWIFYLIWR